MKDNGFVFNEDEFRRGILEDYIKEYIKEKETNVIPRTYISEGGYQLGQIVYGAKNPNHYGHDIIKEYNISLANNNDNWNNNYLLLKQFVSKN